MSGFEDLCNSKAGEGVSLCIFNKIQRFPRPFTFQGKTIYLNDNLTDDKKVEKEKQDKCKCVKCCYEEQPKKLPLPVIERNERRNETIF